MSHYMPVGRLKCFGGESFCTVRLTVRPALTLVNALPEMNMRVGYRAPTKAGVGGSTGPMGSGCRL